MKLIVGLGNPGQKYSETRHNVGFQVIATLAERNGVKSTFRKHEALLGKGTIAGEKVILAQPLTYMNNSGRAVVKLLSEYNIKSENLLVIYDDIDLPTGEIRIKLKGRSGGHRGLKSIIDQLGTNEFPRIRIGIDHPGDREEVVNYVLERFSRAERKEIDAAIDSVIEALELIISDGFEQAMNKYN